MTAYRQREPNRLPAHAAWEERQERTALSAEGSPGASQGPWRGGPERQLAAERRAALRLARRMGLAAPDAEDMVHDALLACLISIRSGAYSPRRGTVGCWFRSALRNRIIDHWRRLARGGAKVTSEDPLGLEARALDVGGFAEHGSLRESVMMALALDELDQRSHAAPRSAEVIRSAMAGVSVEQMARRLGTTPARLSLTKHRAVPRVVAIVRRLEHDSPARVDR